MILDVHHVTIYRYDTPVRGVVQSHRLQPSVFQGQRLLNWSVEVSGGIKGGAFRDGAGDWISAWTVTGPVSEITVSVKGRVETDDTLGVLRGHREVTPPLAYLRTTPLTEADAALSALGREAVDGVAAELDRAHRLSSAVAEAILYRPGSTRSETSAAEAMALGEGVCQDHAHALIATARDVGMPARYVSGYLHTDEAGNEHEASHAWAEIHVDGFGWVGFDPANKCCPDERYIRIGSGFDAKDAALIRGTARGSGEESLDVTVAVQSVQQ